MGTKNIALFLLATNSAHMTYNAPTVAVSVCLGCGANTMKTALKLALLGSIVFAIAYLHLYI